jgi:stage II sporulation protein D
MKYNRFWVKAFIVIFVVLTTTLDVFGMGNRPPRQRKIIRVAVVRNKRQLTLTIKGYYEMYALGTDMKILSGSYLKEAKIIPTYSGLKINNKNFKIYGFKILTDKDGVIFLDNRRFRGHIDIMREKNLTLLVINYIDIEDYLFGVLQYEVAWWWPYAALKAQAIAARTYALYQSEVNKEKDYDLTNDTFSQMYGGANRERYRTRKAVIRTQSKVLTYDGKIFPAYYHATCGGHTENAAELWNIDLPPLKGVKCDFCEKSPHYYWEAQIALKTIEEKLTKEGYEISDIKDIVPLERNRSNRIRSLEILHKNGSLKIKGDKFRLLVGSRYIRSTNFTVNIVKGKAFFKGYGWGHGVGLCQWGAYFMSKKGYKTREILEYYYPESEIKNYFEIGYVGTE